VQILGPPSIEICACDDIEFVLRNETSQSAIVEAQKKHGPTRFTRAYRAQVDLQCAGGGHAAASPQVQWALSETDYGFSLSASALATYQCPAGPVATCTCATPPYPIVVTKARCLITVVTALAEGGGGHSAIRLECGEPIHLDGFYPDAVIPNGVVRVLEATSTDDQIGPHYEGYFPTLWKSFWVIETDCDHYAAVEKYWDDLAQAPGGYQDDGWNASTRAYNSLVEAGLRFDEVVPDAARGTRALSSYRPDLLADLMDQNVGERTASDGSKFTVRARVNVEPTAQT
jgi:hypothetical protein